MWCGCVFVEYYVAALVVVQAGKAFHEVADFFPFVVVAFEEVGAVLDGGYDGAAFGDFGFRGECEVDSCCEGDDWGEGGLGWGFVFVVAEGAVVEDAVCALEIGDCRVAHVDVGFWGSRCEFGRVFVYVVQVVLRLLVYIVIMGKEDLHQTWRPLQSSLPAIDLRLQAGPVYASLAEPYLQYSYLRSPPRDPFLGLSCL